MNTIVSTNWVYKNINIGNLIIFDCSWYLPQEKRDTYIEFKNCHINNSHFFNIDKISDNKTKLPHMAPSKSFFQKKMREFGVNINSKIILYDTSGIFSSPRVWWLFKYFGHNNVFVMNGGLKKWIKEKKQTTKKVKKIKKGNFIAIENINLKTDYKKIMKNLYNNKILILDARNSNRFSGKINEPRKGLKSGHIPGSKNLFWNCLINYNGTIKSKNELIKIFKKFNINNKKEVITSCGSGITACILSLAIFHSTNINTKVYDGSWSEWGMKKLPINK